ncbi:MAG TPA: hypothetical protein VGK25_03730 [Ignavibacteria bacterium]|jgi:hypothetical protein
MKRTLYSILLLSVIVIAAYIGGCSDTPLNPGNNQQQNNQGDATCATGIDFLLTAGQHTVVGNIHVSNDATNLYVTYTITDPNCTEGINTLHLWVGTDLADVPSTPNGTPIPGQFPYTGSANGGTTYTFTIPFSSLNISDVNNYCLTNLYILAHAEACGETAWGGNNPVNVDSPGRWYFYAVYPICCDNGTPDPPVCNTAFGKGGYVWTTSSQSNPENLPSLNLMRNRWGWAIKLTQPGTTNYQIWSGAGLNNTGNGSLVGTLTVIWDGLNVIVRYNITSTGCVLTEVHLYAGDDSPTKIAPGQFGNQASFNPGVTTYTFNVPLEDTNGGGVWLVAHAKVCCGN